MHRERVEENVEVICKRRWYIDTTEWADKNTGLYAIATVHTLVGIFLVIALKSFLQQ